MLLRVGDDDFDENEAIPEVRLLSFLHGSGIPLWVENFRSGSWSAVYPVGVPCAYLFLVYRSRPYLNPEPWFIIADVKRSGEFSGFLRTKLLRR